MAFVLVANLTDIDRVGEQAIERAARQWLTAPALTLVRHLGRGNNPARFEILLQKPDTAEFEIALEDMAHGLGIGWLTPVRLASAA
jgi:hypothetical protein